MSMTVLEHFFFEEMKEFVAVLDNSDPNALHIKANCFVDLFVDFDIEDFCAKLTKEEIFIQSIFLAKSIMVRRMEQSLKWSFIID